MKLGPWLIGAAACLSAAACNAPGGEPARNADRTGNDAGRPAARLTLTRLDCGTATIKNFDEFFSDRPGLYEKAPREITDSCYLIGHGDDQAMLWDTGFATEAKGKPIDWGPLVATLRSTLPEQLAQLGLKPSDIDVVGISHEHDDHTGQAALFPQARLVVGRGDFEGRVNSKDPFGPWRGDGKKVTLATGDVDIFGDGSVVALHLPGHTPNHLALLVNLASGPVLLSGDLYHSADARQKRGVPPFNTDRAQTLESMDKFEALAKRLGAKIIIQHEPADIAKLPAFPQAAE